MLINEVFVSKINFFQKHSKNLTKPKHLNGSVYHNKSFATIHSLQFEHLTIFLNYIWVSLHFSLDAIL